MDQFRIDSEDVAIERDEVGQLAHLKRALAMLLAAPVGGVLRHHLHRLVHRDRLISTESHVVATDGLAGDRTFDAVEGIHCAHRRIGSASHDESGIHHVLDLEQTVRAFLTQAQLAEIHEVLKPHRLDGYYTGNLGRTLDESVGHQRGMNEVEAARVAHCRIVGALERSEHHIVRRVADSMNRNVMTSVVGGFHQLVQLFLRVVALASSPYRILVILEHERTGRSDAAVGKHLDGA